jgi:hypothetical protein
MALGKEWSFIVFHYIPDTKWPSLSGIFYIARLEGESHVFTYLPRMFIWGSERQPELLFQRGCLQPTHQVHTEKGP